MKVALKKAPFSLLLQAGLWSFKGFGQYDQTVQQESGPFNGFAFLEIPRRIQSLYPAWESTSGKYKRDYKTNASF